MPLWHLYFNKIFLYLQSIIIGHPPYSNYNFGTICPKALSLKLGSGDISPVAAYCSEQPGAVCQGCIAPPLYGGLPLIDGPGGSIFWRRDGGISSRAAPFPEIGKGRGIGLNIKEVLLMNFTNSPYERIIKEVPRYEKLTPQKVPEGSPCAGCSYWRKITCVFCYWKYFKEQS